MSNNLVYLSAVEQISQWGGRASALEVPAFVDVFWAAAQASIREVKSLPPATGANVPARPLEVAVIASHAFNTCTTICRETDGSLVDLIGLHAGLVERLSEVFFGFAEVAGLIDELKAASLIASKEISASFALTKVALDFVLRHELAHLHNGHIDFQSARGTQILTEDDFVLRPDFDLTRCTLEFDADCRAVVMTCAHGLRDAKRAGARFAKDHPLGAPLNFIYRTPATFAYHFGVALYGFFAVSIQEPIAVTQGTGYPASQLRLMWVMDTVATLESAKNVPEGFTKCLMTGVAQAFAAAARSHGKAPEKQLFQMWFELRTGPLLGAIRQEWARIRGQLEPFNRGGKLAPAHAE